MKVISQDTFDSVVLENIVEFDNSLEDAIVETIQEFEAQGVQMMNIVKNPKLNEDKSQIVHEILQNLDVVKQSLTTDIEAEELCEALKFFSNDCRVSLAHRVLATKHDAYSILLERIKKSKDDDQILGFALQAMANLSNTNGDILTPEGTDLMIELLQTWRTHVEAVMLQDCLIRWCLECCLKHENNRQTLFEAGIPSQITQFIRMNSLSLRVAKSCLRALRAFVLDDDIRIEFSKAHDHARSLVEGHNLLKVSLEMVKIFPDDSEIVSEILATLNKLCVRAEYCQQAVDSGALEVVNNILITFPDSVSLNRQAINLLRTICGNDRVKDQVMKIGVSGLVVSALGKHQKSEGLSESCCACISMLALRVPANAKLLIQLGAGEVVTSAMKIHTKNKNVQKFCCMAVRNLSARVAENQAVLVECGAEMVIHDGLMAFGDDANFVDLAKAALRDLGCDVKLQERWKGTGKEIERGDDY